jgi:hypothetical protein
VLLGNSRLMDRWHVDVRALGGEAERLTSKGRTVMFVAVGRVRTSDRHAAGRGAACRARPGQDHRPRGHATP